MVVTLPRVALTPAWLRVKNMLTGGAPDCILPATPELRPFQPQSCCWSHSSQAGQVTTNYISDQRCELNADLGFLWDEIYKLSPVQSSPVQTPADKCKNVR